MINVTQQIRQYKQQNNYTWSEVASQLQISTPTLWRILHKDNKTRESTLTKISSILMKYSQPKPEAKQISPQPDMIRERLTSPEDIIDALMDGQTVINETSDTELKYYNGMTVRYRNNLPIFINSAIDCSETYYVIKPKPIIMEVGTSYVLQNGTIGFCFQNSEHTYSLAIKDIGVKIVDLKGVCEDSQYSVVKEA